MILIGLVGGGKGSMQLSPKLQSHKDNCTLTFREDFHSINKCSFQSSVTQMSVPILPPVWTALAVL